MLVALGLLLLGLRAHAATLPTLYDVPANQGNQSPANKESEVPQQGYTNYGARDVPYREYYPQQVNPGVRQRDPRSYYNYQGNDVYDPRNVWYGGQNTRNPDVYSGYYPYGYVDPRYGYTPRYPFGVPYGPQNGPYYYPYNFYPYRYDPRPYPEPYSNYVNRPQYDDQVYFNGNPVYQPYQNPGQGYPPSGGDDGQQGTDRQPNYFQNGGTESENEQRNDGSGPIRPNNISPNQQVPYNPVSATYSGSGQPTAPLGYPVDRPAPGNGNGQDQYLYLDGQTGQTLPNIGGGVPSYPSYQPFPQQPPGRQSVLANGPRDNLQGQYLSPNGQAGGPNVPNLDGSVPFNPNSQTYLPQENPQRPYTMPTGQTGDSNAPTLVGGIPYNPTSQTVPQQPRYPDTGPGIPSNAQGVVNGQQFPTWQQGTNGRPLTPEEIQSIFGQPLNTPSSENQEGFPKNQENGGNVQQGGKDTPFPNGAGVIPQGVQRQGDGQSVYLVNGEPLPPEVMDEVRRIQSGNTGK